MIMFINKYMGMNKDLLFELNQLYDNYFHLLPMDILNIIIKYTIPQTIESPTYNQFKDYIMNVDKFTLHIYGIIFKVNKFDVMIYKQFCEYDELLQIRIHHELLYIIEVYDSYPNFKIDIPYGLYMNSLSANSWGDDRLIELIKLEQ